MLASWQVLGLAGYGTSHHLQTLNSSSGQRISNPTSNFLVFLNPSNCTVFLPSIGTKLGHDYSDSSWIHISNIIPPLYPIVIHLFILVGYPTYRDKNLYLCSPYSTSWNIIILSRVKRPYRGILAISAWHFFNWET